jgi:hypothetical protein
MVSFTKWGEKPATLQDVRFHDGVVEGSGLLGSDAVLVGKLA